MQFLTSIVVFYALFFVPAFILSAPIANILAKSFDVHFNFESKFCKNYFFVASVISSILFLLIFSLLGRLIDSYYVLLPFCYVALFAIKFLILSEGRLEKFRILKFKVVFKLPTFGLPNCIYFISLHSFLLYIRSFFSNITFDPNLFGAEKLFNLQFQQSFLYGKGFPPENIWFANENSGYYILPKAIAGLSSWIIRVLFSNSLSGGYLFHIADTFFVTLSAVLLFNCIFIFASLSKSSESDESRIKPGKYRMTFLALCLSLLPLIAFPFRAIQQTFKNSLELWSLSRIIENTITEYPFWNFLWADNHAHSTAIFIQLCFWLLLIAQLKNLQQKNTALQIILAAVATVVLMSHSGSVLIDISLAIVASTFCLVHAFKTKQLNLAVQNIAAISFYTLCFSLPDLLTRGQPNVKWYFVTSKYTSTLSEFLNINFTLSMALAALFIPFTLIRFKNENRTNFSTTIFFLTGVSFCILGYPVVGFLLVISHFLISAVSKNSTSLKEWNAETYLNCGAISAAFSVWITPELIASNWDMGDAYMRYNSLFRFQFESFYIVPFFLCFALKNKIQNFLLPQKRFVLFCTGILILFIVGGIVQYKTFQHRLQRVNVGGGFNGMAFLEAERPADWHIIEALGQLKGRVVIAEECGIQPKPGNYTISGRISAYSGRPAICGWANHVALFHNIVHQKEYEGQGAFGHLLDRNKWTNALFNFNKALNIDGKIMPELNDALLNFLKMGVTHLVWGQWEKENHKLTTLEDLKTFGKIIYLYQDLGIIELDYSKFINKGN